MMEAAEMLAEDVVSPEVVGVFGVLVHVFHLPQLRQLYVFNILASLNLGSTVFKYVTPRITSFAEEVVERSGGDGFWKVVEMDVCAVDRKDGVDLRTWVEMKMIMVMKMKMKTAIDLLLMKMVWR